jgi:hypothetical protein
MTSHAKPQALQAEDANPASRGHAASASAAGGGLLSVLPSDPDEYQALEKRLVRKIDWRLMPVLVVMIVLK